MRFSLMLPVFVDDGAASPFGRTLGFARTADELGYPVPPAHVFGVRVEVAEDGLLTTAMPPAERYPLTYRQGKVDLIRLHIPGEPLLVAGDTFTDYEMLVGFERTEVVLLVNRNRGGEIGALYREALGEDDGPPAPGERCLLLYLPSSQRALPRLHQTDEPIARAVQGSA